MSDGYRDIPWDEIYSLGRHRDSWDRSEPAPELVEFIEGRTWCLGHRALDLGCGTGSDAMFLAECGFVVSAVDISERAVHEARERHGAHAVEWAQADVCALPFEDSSQDLVVDGACLHHFTRDQWFDYAREVARVTRPGGLLFVRGVSKLHRATNILDESWIADVFGGGGDFDIESIAAFSMLGAHGRRAPGLAAVVVRT